MAQNYQPRISNDRFGRPYQLKFAKQAYNKKSGEYMDNIFKTSVELNGKTYLVEVSHANKTKTTKHGDTVNGMWVKVTKVEAQRQKPQSM